MVYSLVHAFIPPLDVQGDWKFLSQITTGAKLSNLQSSQKIKYSPKDLIAQKALYLARPQQ